MAKQPDSALRVAVTDVDTPVARAAVLILAVVEPILVAYLPGGHTSTLQ